MALSRRATHHIVDKVGSLNSPALELDVAGADASINDIGGDALAGGFLEHVGLTVGGAARQADEARRSVGLSHHVDGDPGVGLDVGDLGRLVDVHDHGVVGVESHGAPIAHAERHYGGGEGVARQTAFANVTLLDGSSERSLPGVDGVIVKGIVVYDNVSVGYDISGLGVRDGDAEDGVEAVVKTWGQSSRAEDESRQAGEEIEERHGDAEDPKEGSPGETRANGIKSRECRIDDGKENNQRKKMNPVREEFGGQRKSQTSWVYQKMKNTPAVSKGDQGSETGQRADRGEGETN